MHIVVTGGAGYIGSTTTAHLLEAGHRVTVLDDLREGHAEAVPAGARLVEAAITDTEAVQGILDEGVDGVVHFAAYLKPGESMEHPERYFANNTAGTLLLLEQLVAAGVERFVLSSTCAVYGQPESVPVTEEEPTKPESPYGHSKLMVEQVLGWLHELRGLRYAALRYFNAAGGTPERGERHDPEIHLIPLVLQTAAGQREAIHVFGDDYDTPDGTCVRDYIHIDDLAAAHVAALDAVDTHGAIVCNLGVGRGHSVLEVIETARRVTGREIPVVVDPRRPGDPAFLYADPRRARELLGWEPQRTELDDIVASAWEWLQTMAGEQA
jgi:UDP-glucose 4-epimerase